MHKVDKIFLGLLISLAAIGVFIFISASLGVLAKNTDKFYSIIINQLVLGLGFGLLAFWAASRISYKFWQKYSLFIFLGALILTALVFVPGLGFEHAGARRWISLGFFSFQPAEFLKIGFIIYFAAWLSSVRGRISNIKWTLLPFLILIGLSVLILLRQPDVKSLILILVSALTMLFLSGISWKKILSLIVLVLVGFLILVYFKPYLLDRVLTFVNPSRDPQGSSYQLQQSLIAIGSGGISGRGLGQSVQKFTYLPEPQGDSIFAVVGEEFGFIGSSLIVLLFFVFFLRGFRIVYRAPDLFSRLLVAGIVILITAQAFLNIASVTGVFPLTGVPLPFMSHGGTSLFVMFLAVGIVLSISRYQLNK